MVQMVLRAIPVLTVNLVTVETTDLKDPLDQLYVDAYKYCHMTIA